MADFFATKPWICRSMFLGFFSSSSDGKESIWLIAPLIAKLSSAVQGRILKHAGQVLETSNSFWSAKNSKDRERYLQKRLASGPFQFVFAIILQGTDF